MHELTITQGILDLVVAAVEREGGGRVTAVDLVVGELANVVDDSIQFYWEFVAADSCAAGARLRFRRVPLRFECRNCHGLFAPAGGEFCCPQCGSRRLRVAAGDELRVESFAFEPDAARPREGGSC